MSNNLNQLNINSTSTAEITAYRNELKANGNDLQKNHINRAYNNPQSIVNEMRDSPYFLSAQLAYEVGLRADDAIHSDKWTLNSDNTIHISGSKNGINYTSCPLSDETAQRVKNAIESGYKVNYGEFREVLKEAVESCNEKWTGIHGLRYSFAQEALSNGASKSEISLILGHSRNEIVDIYL